MASRFSASHLRPVKSPKTSPTGYDIVSSSTADGSVEKDTVVDDEKPRDQPSKIEPGLHKQNIPVSEKRLANQD